MKSTEKTPNRKWAHISTMPRLQPRVWCSLTTRERYNISWCVWVTVATKFLHLVMLWDAPLRVIKVAKAAHRFCIHIVQSAWNVVQYMIFSYIYYLAEAEQIHDSTYPRSAFTGVVQGEIYCNHIQNRWTSPYLCSGFLQILVQFRSF